MARKRDIAIGVIIAFCFLLFGSIFVVTMFDMYSGEGASMFAFGDRIAIIDVYGMLSSSADIVRQIQEYGDDNSVVAILLHVDSPGGGVAVSQEIYDEISRVRIEEGKLVVTSASSVIASGAYYIACASDMIITNPGTLVGSIGVILQYPVVDELIDKIGIDFETIKSGDVKDVGSPYREATDEDREMLQAAIDDSYEQFIEVIMEGRDLTREEVIEVADGAVFTGRQGMDLGLVDRIASFEEAIRITAELAGIDGKPRTVKERPRKDVTLFDLFKTDLSGLLDGRLPFPGPQLQYLYR